MAMTPTVSVIMITYKHELFLAQAIESVLSQRTTFDFELVIADDYSPDSTPEIVSSFIAQHSRGNLIKYYRHNQNIGMNPNGLFALSKGKGKYIAFCEGDDYWTDPLKLQKQVEFLESNKDYSAVCTNVYRKIESTGELLIDERLNQKENEDIDLITLHKRHPCIYTPTFLFRSNAFTLHNWLSDFIAGDIVVFSGCAINGRIRYLVDITTVYRSHNSSATHSNNRNIVALWSNHIELLERLNEVSAFKYNYEFKKLKIKYLRFINLSKEKVLLKRLFFGGLYFFFDTKRTIRDLKNTILLVFPYMKG